MYYTGTSAIHEAVIRGLPDVVLKLLERLSHDEQREILALETRYGERPADLVFHHTQIPEVYRPETCPKKLYEVGQLLARQHQFLELQTPDRNNGLLVNLLANIAIVLGKTIFTKRNRPKGTSHLTEDNTLSPHLRLLSPNFNMLANALCPLLPFLLRIIFLFYFLILCFPTRTL